MAKMKNSLTLLQVQKGFSLVELMVAILIGLIILAGVVQVVVTSKTTFIAQEEMSFIQENARYAMNQIANDIRESGYLGCAGSVATVALVSRTTQAGVHDLLAFNNGTNYQFVGVSGFESKPGGQADVDVSKYPKVLSDANPWQAEDVDTDTLIIRKLSGSPVQIERQQAATFQVAADGDRFGNDDYVGIVGEDCRRVTLARTQVSGSNTSIALSATNCSAGSNIKPIVGAQTICGPGCAGCNVGALTSQRYQIGSSAYNYEAFAYFISESSVISGEPALKRLVASGDGVTTEELALGVEALDVLYAVFDGSLRLLRADEITNWSQVTGIELSVTFRSQSRVPDFGPGLDYIRQTVKTFIELRNS